MQRASKDILYFETGPDNEPTMYVEPGEEFEVETQIGRGPWLEDHPDREAYLFLGQVLEARCTQFVNPTFSYVAKVNGKYLPKSRM